MRAEPIRDSLDDVAVDCYGPWRHSAEALLKAESKDAGTLLRRRVHRLFVVRKELDMVADAWASFHLRQRGGRVSALTAIMEADPARPARVRVAAIERLWRDVFTVAERSVRAVVTAVVAARHRFPRPLLAVRCESADSVASAGALPGESWFISDAPAAQDRSEKRVCGEYTAMNNWHGEIAFSPLLADRMIESDVSALLAVHAQDTGGRMSLNVTECRVPTILRMLNGRQGSPGTGLLATGKAQALRVLGQRVCGSQLLEAGTLSGFLCRAAGVREVHGAMFMLEQDGHCISGREVGAVGGPMEWRICDPRDRDEPYKSKDDGPDLDRILVLGRSAVVVVLHSGCRLRRGAQLAEFYHGVTKTKTKMY